MPIREQPIAGLRPLENSTSDQRRLAESLGLADVNIAVARPAALTQVKAQTRVQVLNDAATAWAPRSP
ncbi:MAG: hypothetical protein AB1651_08120 [Pseudomonadota bacterium]